MDIQNEFDKLMAERNERKVNPDIPTNDEFYAIMDDYYHNNLPRHQSPNKRLTALKNSTVEHKTLLKDNFRQSQDYNL